MSTFRVDAQAVHIFNWKISRRRLSELSLLLFMLPAMILVIAFVIVPAAWAIYISFTNQSLVGPNAKNFSFIGLDNYVRLFSDGRILELTQN